MSLPIAKGPLVETIQVPPSKSYANRALILAALKKTPFTLHDLPDSTDVTHLIQALHHIGLRTSTSVPMTLLNSFPECEGDEGPLEVGEGGTTARFLACLLLRGQRVHTLNLGPKLSTRPWEEFLSFVRAHGGRATLSGEKLTLQGPLDLQGEIEVDCSRTTQFASGLQLVFSETAIIIPKNMTSSMTYWKMTEELIRIVKSGDEFSIPRDWSSASYPLAFAALHHTIHFPGLVEDPYQADAKFLKLLEELGCVERNRSGLVVHPLKKSQSVTMDVSDCLDLVPALAYLLSHVEGTHRLTGVRNLAHKESDRLSEVISLLSTFQRKTSTNGEELLITGSTQVLGHPIDLVLPDDHRMVMAGVLFLRHHGGGSVSPSEAVKKSYPGFYKLLKG